MKFDLDRPNECDRFAVVLASLQQNGVRFEVIQDEQPAGGFSRYVTINFDVRKNR